jgi:hypothetical protein
VGGENYEEWWGALLSQECPPRSFRQQHCTAETFGVARIIRGRPSQYARVVMADRQSFQGGRRILWSLKGLSSGRRVGPEARATSPFEPNCFVIGSAEQGDFPVTAPNQRMNQRKFLRTAFAHPQALDGLVPGAPCAPEGEVQCPANLLGRAVARCTS